MAATERPVPADRMPILLAMESPGRESRTDFAASLGSFWGTWGTWGVCWRAEEVVEKAGAAVRRGIEGRARTAPGGGQYGCLRGCGWWVW
jgi:hypothetical protein